jgi:glycerophosphoryl diester phosphodiesterase
MIVTITVLLILIALVLFLIAPAKALPEQKKAFYKRNFAHRGLYTQDQSVPENSMEAFRAAVAAGYGIELDIRLTKDGQVVVFHDDTLARVCGIEGRVDDYTLEELRGFALYGTDQRIPLFTEVLHLVDGRVPLIVELKNGPWNAQLCEKAWAILLQYTGAFCVESFDPRIVAWWKKHARQVLRGQLSSNYRDLRKHQGAVISFALSRLLTNVLARPHFVAYSKHRTSHLAKLCVQMGAMPVVFTARPEDDTDKLQRENEAVIFEYYTPRIRY